MSRPKTYTGATELQHVERRLAVASRLQGGVILSLGWTVLHTAASIGGGGFNAKF